MRMLYQTEDIEKEFFEYGRKLHRFESTKKRDSDQVRTIQKIRLSYGMKIEMIIRKIDKVEVTEQVGMRVWNLILKTLIDWS